MRLNFFSACASPVSAPRSPDRLSSAEETSSTMRAAFCIRARWPASLSSSPAWGSKSDNSCAAARTKSASICARSASALRPASASRAAASSPCSAATIWASPFRPPNPSSRARWVAVSNRPRSSCWPWTSSSKPPRSFSRPTPTASSLMKARLRPSAARVPAQHDLAIGTHRLSGQQRVGGMLLFRLEHRGWRCPGWRPPAPMRGHARRPQAPANPAGWTCPPRSRRSAH